MIDQLVIDNYGLTESAKVQASFTLTSATVGVHGGGQAFLAGAHTHVMEHAHQAAMEMLGESANALQMAKLLGSAQKIHVHSMLDGVGLGKIDYNLPVNRTIFELLFADTGAAKAENATTLAIDLHDVASGCQHANVVASNRGKRQKYVGDRQLHWP